MSIGFERKLPIVSAFVFLMLATIGFVFYQSTVSAQQALEWQRHSQDIIYRLDEVVYLTQDSEAAVRGYTMVGSDTYLEPHRRAETRIRQDLAYLRQRIGANKDQLDELGRLDGVVSEYLALAADAIVVRGSDGADAAEIKFSPQRVKTTRDALRVSAEKIKALEAGLLDRRQKSQSNSLYVTIWILIISTFAGATALLLANSIVFREFRKRRSAESALIDANQSLELKVAERTQKLEKVNDALMHIDAEREVLLRNEKDARREAEIANRLRDEFMATVSHELRTPLNSILGWARLLKDGSLDQEQIDKAVSTIIRSSENQNRLIEDLLDVARLISGKLQLDREDLNIFEVVEHSVESLRPAAARKDVQIKIENSLRDDSYVSGDRDRLVQVFSNLLENAIKFSNKHGHVTVAISANGPNVVISVKDEGAGISPEFLPQVFERFRQDADREGTVNAGLGLGLAIVRNLVELHEGTVSVASEGEGSGSEFTVTLPLKPEAELALHDPSDRRDEVVRNDVGLNI